MRTVFDEYLSEANAAYAERKLGKDAAFRAPECRPTIVSDQVKSVLQVLSDEVTRLNDQLDDVRSRLRDLEDR